MDRCSSSGDSSPRRERLRSSRKKIKAREKVEKSEHCTFLMFCGSCSKARTAVAQREAHFEVKMLKASKQILKTPDARSTFGSWDFQVSGAVARSTFGSRNVENTPASEHFWTLRCWKSAHRCCGKHISKSKWSKHTTFGPLLDVLWQLQQLQLLLQLQLPYRLQRRYTTLQLQLHHTTPVTTTATSATTTTLLLPLKLQPQLR